jgi:phage FluMu gp28-like protein
MDTHGEACFIGTPKGKNFFHELYLKGKDKLEPDFMNWTFSSYDNSTIPNIKEEIDKAKQEMPQTLFEQEIMAVFNDDLGGVFRNVDGCAIGQLQDPVHTREYYMGVDLAKYEDFTVLCVMCKKTKSLVAFDRFNKIDWNVQEQKILELATKYNNADILLDQGMVGDMILENLQRRYKGKVEGIKFTNDNKTDMINKLSNLIEKGQIKYPISLGVLRDELKIYGYERLASGKLRMNAPSGYHDDCVIALGLACWDLQMEGGAPLEFYSGQSRTFGKGGVEGTNDMIDDDSDDTDRVFGKHW